MNYESVSQEEFEQDMAERKSPESQEELTQEILDSLDEEDREFFSEWLGTEVTVYRDMTGTIAGIVIPE